MTSSGHTGERAIHSSDFSAFTKRLHRPSLLRFLTQLLPAIIHLHFGDCLSGTLFSSRWSAMEFRRCMPPCTRFIAREDPHSKCILCLGFSHACEAVYGTSNCKICDDFRLITLRSRLEDYERESSKFSQRASSTNACFRAPPKSLHWIGPMSPASLELRSSTIASSSARTPSLKGGSCHFSVICIVRSPVPGSSHFPLALLTRQPLTSPTLWVLWSRVTPPCQWLRILWPHIFHLLWLLLGSPAPSFLPSRVGPLPPLSGSPTSRPVRQVWPFTQWPSFRPTRRTSWRKWTKGPA